MDENYHYQPVNKAAKPSQSRPSRQAGEIVEVQGGHIVRSTGLKDRHSKVCTAKGPRDRRVRLSAHTAIQFYDVQDRLGYDRPSKAVDWLIKKAKASIDELAELPPWTPTNLAPINQNPDQDNNNNIDNTQMGCSQNSRFLPESLDSVKSFFPVNNNINNINNNNNNDNNNNNNNNNQDLKLSLQSIQDPITQHQPGNNINNNNIYFDGSENGGFGFGFGFMVNSNAPAMFGQPTNNQLLNYISQRGPLQSSNSPPVRAWVDPLPFVGAGVYPTHQTLGFNNPFPVPGFGSGMGGLSGFDVPARIPGEEEERDGLSDKPSSGSSDSRH